MKKYLSVILNWFNENATKRFMLLLDRICYCWLFTCVFSDLVAVNPERYFNLEAVIIGMGSLFFFLCCYTPSYMFPGSNSPVGNDGDKNRIDRLVKRVQRLEEKLLKTKE